MKLKEWFDFNRGLFNCDYIVKVIKNKSTKTYDILFETVCRQQVCEKFFGQYELAKVGCDHYPKSENVGIMLILWADMDE